MAQLYFKYGAMGSSKTANALMARFNYEERGQETLMVKPRLDTRDGDHMVTSRIGLTHPCVYFDEMRARPDEELQKYACIIIDEAQFLTKDEVFYLVHLVDDCGIPVLCYGLKADFRGQLFEGSYYLLAMADKLEEVKTVCWCGKKAMFNARFDENGKVYSIVSPMVIKNSSPLAGVDGVFNAIMVTGDCVGDVMFYGKGAGKLPTASAVVADVVDAVKHSDRSKKIFWEKPAENIMADIDSKKFEYFVRTTDSAENVQKIFGKCEFVDNIIDNESAFVTSPLTKSEVEEKLAKLSDVVANIRVMD